MTLLFLLLLLIRDKRTTLGCKLGRSFKTRFQLFARHRSANLEHQSSLSIKPELLMVAHKYYHNLTAPIAQRMLFLMIAAILVPNVRDFAQGSMQVVIMNLTGVLSFGSN